MAKLPKRINNSKKNLEDIIKEKTEKKEFTEIEIKAIDAPKFHDRRYISKHSIHELSESIKATSGLIYPIVVRRKADGRFERIIGYRRIEAYRLLKKEKIPAIILDNISDSDALLLMTTENMQRENLSPYDETLALLDFISVSLQTTSEQVKKYINRFKNYDSGLIILSEEEKEIYAKIEKILEKTGKITFSTLANKIPILNLNPIIKEALSQGKLSFSNAKILDEIKDDEILKRAIDEVVSKRMSKREAAKFVKSLIGNNKEKSDLEKSLKKISKLKIEKIPPENKEEIEYLIEKILKLAQK